MCLHLPTTCRAYNCYFGARLQLAFITSVYNVYNVVCNIIYTRIYILCLQLRLPLLLQQYI